MLATLVPREVDILGGKSTDGGLHLMAVVSSFLKFVSFLMKSLSEPKSINFIHFERLSFPVLLQDWFRVGKVCFA